jgi:hypothetical protein
MPPINKYYGVFCVDDTCRSFNVRGTYRVFRQEEIAVHLILDHLTDFRCPKCGNIASYQQSDVAHSASKDGREPQYPHKC